MSMTIVAAMVLTLAAASPRAQSDDVAGHYVLRGVMEVGSELLLKPDGQFEFMLAYGAADYFAKGTWHRDKDGVHLKTTGTKEEPFRFLHSEPGTAGRIRVSVIGKNGRGVPNIRVTLHSAEGDPEAQTTEDGAAVFPDVKKPRAVSFEVRVYQVEAGPFDINPEHKDISFEINGDAIQQVVFEDERLAIEQDTLVMTHWGTDHPMRYEKQ
jgi:hypothetical protein